MLAIFLDDRFLFAVSRTSPVLLVELTFVSSPLCRAIVFLFKDVFSDPPRIPLKPSSPRSAFVLRARLVGLPSTAVFVLPMMRPVVLQPAR